MNSKKSKSPAAGYITGRNGTFEVTQVVVEGLDTERVRIGAIGRSGRVINGGMRVRREYAINAFKDYLRSVGYEVVPKLKQQTSLSEAVGTTDESFTF